MLNDLSQAIYAPILRLKLGELKALGSLPKGMVDRVLPVFDVPPGDLWDWDALRRISAAEHIRTFGARLQKYRGTQPVFVDVTAIENSVNSSSLECHPMTALTERARQAGAQAFPVVSLRSTPACLEAARRYLARHPEGRWMLRFQLPDFDRPGAFRRIEELLLSLGRGPETGVLLVDSHNTQQFSDAFAGILVERMSEFPMLPHWENAFYASTSFPKNRKIAIGSVGRFPRHDRAFYQDHVLRNSNLVRGFRYSDYGVEFPGKFAKGGGAPRAHLRFTSTASYLISEGPSTKEVGFSAIKPVAGILASQAEFRVAPPSTGRSFIETLKSGDARGTPTLWRWCATDHHFAVVCRECFDDLGIPLVSLPEQISESQQTLL